MLFFSFNAISAQTIPKMLEVDSGWYYVPKDDVQLWPSYTGFDPIKQERFSNLSIGNKALDMIKNSKKLIFASVFLFDCFYSESASQRDIVGELTQAVLEQKKLYPDIKVILILDPVNRGYSDRVSPAVKILNDNGVDVFYTDLIETKSSTALGIGHLFRQIGRGANDLTFGILGGVSSLVTNIKLPISNPIDERGVSIQSVWSASALKANHKKILITDINGNFEALISSANPHNASVSSTNFAVSVKGDVAKYIYMTLRSDVENSLKRNKVDWSNDSIEYRLNYMDNILPQMNHLFYQKAHYSHKTPIAVKYISEQKIKDNIMSLLQKAEPEDEIRIQMFYLSDFKVVDQIATTSAILKKPLRIILDPSKDAFNAIKDGTPNRQVAAYLMNKKKSHNLNIEIRWYETHGEQNHAKIMTITNHATGKYELINGSANWTGKNLNGANMESNLLVKNSISINREFNQLFDRFWNNLDSMLYTIPYEGKYQKHAGMHKWKNGERFGYVAW